MQNSFFANSLDKRAIRTRIRKLCRSAKVGFYSIGLYPASLAYNSAMQNSEKSLLLAPRPGRELLGAFSEDEVRGMDFRHVEQMHRMATHKEENELVDNDLEYLIEKCDLVLLAANSKYIEEDLADACIIRKKLNRNNVVLACLAGSFNHDDETNDSYVLCEKFPNLAFFSGFHRHGALRDPLDSFTANFCHPNSLTALIGGYILNKLSPNIQVSPGIHNIEAQYIKAAKNMSSIFAGFGYEYHQDNPGVLPTFLTLLLHQCLDQAATVSRSRKDRQQLYNQQTIALTQLGYAVPRIEATLDKGGFTERVRDHTFSQLTAVVADARGSMMLPVSGKPTRNFQAGQILAKGMMKYDRCPVDIVEFENWCSDFGLTKGALEGLKALQYWPQIEEKYGIPNHDSSMINLLYKGLYGSIEEKDFAFQVMTRSRQLSNYCQESIRPTHGRKYLEALNDIERLGNNVERIDALELIANAVIADNAKKAILNDNSYEERTIDRDSPAYLQVMDSIEQGISQQ
jgi:glycerol-3-phosphate dehydrogenase